MVMVMHGCLESRDPMCRIFLYDDHGFNPLYYSLRNTLLSWSWSLCSVLEFHQYFLHSEQKNGDVMLPMYAYCLAAA